MRYFVAKSVGDAQTLFMGGTEYDHSLMLDFGFESRAIFNSCFWNPYQFFNYEPNAFLLSHYHADHYNGFQFLTRKSHFDFKNLYLPCMPIMPHREHVHLAMAFMSLAIYTQSIPVDVVDKICDTSRTRPFIRIVGQGDTFRHNNAQYDVLWPPKRVYDDDILTDVRRAIESFYELLEHDENLRRVYGSLQQSGITGLLDGEEKIEGERQRKILLNVAEVVEDNDRTNSFEHVQNDRYKEANENLRKAANRLSIAFCQEGNVLFLGDLESREIGQVVDYISKHRKPLDYGIIHAAHHGTHWHKDLKCLSADHVTMSVGNNLIPHIAPGYTGIGNHVYNTFVNGDIFLVSQYL